MNLVKIADMLKSSSDQQLMGEMQNPTGSVPSYMVLSELERRKKLRGSVMNPEQQSSVAEDMQHEMSPATQMDAAGLGAMRPQMAPQVQQAPVRGYADGGEVDYGGGYESDPSQNTFWPTWEELKKRTGYGRMLPPTQPTPEKVIPAAVAVQQPTPQVAAPRITPQPRATTQRQTAAPATPKEVALSQEAQDMAKAREEGLAGIGQYGDYLKQAIEENKAQKADNAWQALTMAGLGMLGGRSQFAAENIGQGALMGMQQFQGAEQARQKQGQALAMDMAQSGMKKSEMYSNLAKLGIEGKKADATVTQALAHAQYFKAAAGAQNAAAANAGLGGLKQSQQQIKVLDNEIKDINTQLKGYVPAAERPALIQQRDAKMAERRQLAKLGGGDTMGASNDPLGWRQ